MGVREQLRTYPRTAAAMAGLIVAVSACFLYFQLAGQDPGLGPPAEIFVTTDEGKTYFASPANRLPPFPHEGKTAYRAYVFTCDGGSTTWVGYLERYSEQAKAQMLGMWKAQTDSGAPPALPAGLLEGIEVKRPGQEPWVRQSDTQRAIQIMEVRCRDNPSKVAEMVLP